MKGESERAVRLYSGCESMRVEWLDVKLYMMSVCIVVGGRKPSPPPDNPPTRGATKNQRQASDVVSACYTFVVVDIEVC